MSSAFQQFDFSIFPLSNSLASVNDLLNSQITCLITEVKPVLSSQVRVISQNLNITSPLFLQFLHFF